MEFVVWASVTPILLFFLCALINERWRNKVASVIRDTSPWVFWTLAIALFQICILPLVLQRNFDEGTAVRFLLYCLLPAAFFSVKQRLKLGGCADIFLVLLIFIPAAYRWIDAWALGIPIAYWGMSIYLLAVTPVWSEYEIHARWTLNKGDAKAILLGIFVLSALIVPIATKTGFVHPGFRWFETHSAWHMLRIAYICFFTIALPEEIFVRGVIQENLVKKLNAASGIILASLVFGFAHITRVTIANHNGFGFPNWRYVFFATIAGIVYGYVYEKRRSLVAAALLHGLVDFFWAIFFIS